MIYSVYNYATRLYDYYQAGQPTGTHAPNPPTSLVASPLGDTPDAAAWRLPPGAKKIGSGELARGRVASFGDSSSLLSSSKLPLIAAAAIAAYILTR